MGIFGTLCPVIFQIHNMDVYIDELSLRVLLPECADDVEADNFLLKDGVDQTSFTVLRKRIVARNCTI